MPGTQSLCRTMRPGRIPFRAVKANRFASEFCSPTISHASDRDRLDLIISVGTQGGVITEQGAKTDINVNYDFRNRVYSPTLGRWLTNDPLGFSAGDVNTFRYVGNGPGNGLDPIGLDVKIQVRTSSYLPHQRITVDDWIKSFKGDYEKCMHIPLTYYAPNRFGFNGIWNDDYQETEEWKTIKQLETTVEQDLKIIDIFKELKEQPPGLYTVFGNNCFTKTNGLFYNLKKEFDLKELNPNPKNHTDPITGGDSGIPIKGSDFLKDLKMETKIWDGRK
jgi:RHS repeat-associated protein